MDAEDLKKAYTIKSKYESLSIFERIWNSNYHTRQKLINVFIDKKNCLEPWMREWRLCEEMISYLQNYRDSLPFKIFLKKIASIIWPHENANKIVDDFWAERTYKATREAVDLAKDLAQNLTKAHYKLMGRDVPGQ